MFILELYHRQTKREAYAYNYVMRDEANEQRLISGIECSSDTALEEFCYPKQKYGKEDSRSYYHIMQSFSLHDNLTPETAQEIRLTFTEYFPDYQILVTPHYNTGYIHNHLMINSINHQNGKNSHQNRGKFL